MAESRLTRGAGRGQVAGVSDPDSSADPARPMLVTRERYWVVVFVVTLAAPRLQTRLGPGLGRRLFGVVGFTGAMLSLLAATMLKQPQMAVAAIAFASFSNDLTLPGSWTTCMDVGGPWVGTLSGAMNMVGNIGGFLSPIVLGYVVGRTGLWNVTFYLTAAVYAGGAPCWWGLDPVTPLGQQVEN